jgi:uncharacterized cupredoxin-like copper-binding protein
VAVIGLVLLAFGCTSEPATPDEDGNLNISMADSKFTPDKFDIEAGRTVRVILSNDSVDSDYGFTVGEAGSSNGYATDFFEGVEVEVIGPAKLIRAGEAVLTREDDDAVADSDGNGFTVIVGASTGSVIIEFVVPAKFGEWEFASFEDGGAHYEDGMKGVMKVFPCTRSTAGTGSRNPSTGGRPTC